MNNASKNKKFLPALTGLRGAAALWVLFYHSAQKIKNIDIPIVRSGWMAVDIFFILSGFILAHIHLDDFKIVSVKTIWKFLSLRLARIYPVYIVMLAIVTAYAFGLFAVGVPILSDRQYNPSLFIPNILLIQSWGWVNHTSFNVVSWSISAEWMAYLLFPLLAFLGAKIRTSISFVLSLIFIAGAASFYEIIHPSMTSAISSLIVSTYAPTRVLTEFTSGLFAYNIFKNESFGRVEMGLICDLTIVFFIILVWFNLFSIAVLLIPIIVCGLAYGMGTAARLLALRWALYFGEISYSLYMVQFFVLTIMFAPFHYSRLGAMLTSTNRLEIVCLSYVIIAITTVAMHDYVEVPGRRWLQQRLARISQ